MTNYLIAALMLLFGIDFMTSSAANTVRWYAGIVLVILAVVFAVTGKTLTLG